MNRRDFFKGSVGLGGALLAGGVSASEIPDVDGEGKSAKRHPWWVKEVDKPVMKIDDSVYGRFDPKRNVFGSQMKYIGREKFMKLKRESREKTKRFYRWRLISRSASGSRNSARFASSAPSTVPPVPFRLRMS